MAGTPPSIELDDVKVTEPKRLSVVPEVQPLVPMDSLFPHGDAAGPLKLGDAAVADDAGRSSTAPSLLGSTLARNPSISSLRPRLESGASDASRRRLKTDRSHMTATHAIAGLMEQIEDEEATAAAVNNVLRLWERKPVKRQNHTLDAANDAAVRKRNVIMLILVMVCNTLAVLILQLAWDQERMTLVPRRPAAEICKGLNMILSFVLIGLHVEYYILQGQIELNHETPNGHIPKRAGCGTIFKKSHLRAEFLAGLVVFMIMPIPMLDYSSEEWWWLNDKWALCQVLRLYVGFRVIRDHNPIYANRTEILTSDYGEYIPRFNWWVTVKFLFHKKPGTLVLATSAYCILVMTFAIYVCEREAQELFGNIFMVGYYSSVVLTTVGFGDISPESPIGRFVSMITALLGIVVASLLVALLTTKLTLSYQEASAHQWILVQTYRLKERNLSARLIQLTWRCSKEHNPDSLKRAEKDLDAVREELAFVRRKITKHGARNQVDPRVALQGEQLARTRLQVLSLQRQMKEVVYTVRAIAEKLDVPRMDELTDMDALSEDDFEMDGPFEVFHADPTATRPRAGTSFVGLSSDHNT